MPSVRPFLTPRPRQTKNQKQTTDRGPLKRWETDSLKAYWIGGNQIVIYTKAGMNRYEAEKAAEDLKAAE